MRKVVGLDISLQKTAVCVLDHDGQVVWQGKVDSEPGPLIEKLRLLARSDRSGGPGSLSAFGMAAPAPRCGRLQGHLRRDPPRATFLSTRPVKTDKNDARGIAEMMRIGHYRPVHVKSV